MRIKVFLWMSTVFTLLVSCTGKNEQIRSGMIVKTEKAVQYSGGNGKEYAFISRPYRTSELSFRVGGPIDRFDVYSGNYYSQGSIIAEIDPRDFRIRKERTKAIFLPANMKRQRPIILRPRPPLTWLRTNWRIHAS